MISTILKDSLLNCHYRYFELGTTFFYAIELVHFDYQKSWGEGARGRTEHYFGGRQSPSPLVPPPITCPTARASKVLENGERLRPGEVGTSAVVDTGFREQADGHGEK